MKKRGLLLAALLLLLTLLSACAAGSSAGGDSIFSGGGSASSPGADAGTMPPDGMNSSMDFEYWGEAEPDAPMEAPGSAESSPGQVYTGENAKLIQRAELQLQTTDFPAAEGALSTLVSAHGGYFESSSVQGGGYYDEQAARYGVYVIRVPKDRYEVFLNAAGGLCHVVSLNRSSENVGEAYFDAETHLRTQETKRDRLLALLERADTMESIVSLENALSEAEYQIAMYSTDLRRYDSLVDFATVTVYLDEVLQVDTYTGPADSLGVRMSSALSEGLDGTREAWSNFLVWCAYHLVGLLVTAGILAVAAVLLLRYRRRRRKLFTRPAPPDQTPPGTGSFPQK